jgi:hypothetical protein
VEIDKLISALDETISFLRNSRSSDWAATSVEELIDELESEIARIKNSESPDTKRSRMLFAPTGSIQETSIDNGWGDDFLRLSEIVDPFTAPDGT